jgi:hypothetical protein
MKFKILLLLVAAAACTSLLQGQSSKPHSTSTGSTSGTASLNATKPLTPKSAMPSHRKAAVAAPRARNNANTTAQLTQLERQNSKANSLKSTGTAPAKPVTLKSGSGPTEKNSGIDFKYQKPKTTTGSKGPNPNDATK